MLPGSSATGAVAVERQNFEGQRITAPAKNERTLSENPRAIKAMAIKSPSTLKVWRRDATFGKRNIAAGGLPCGRINIHA